MDPPPPLPLEQKTDHVVLNGADLFPVKEPGGQCLLGGSTDQVEPGVPTLEWIFFRTCLQGLSLTEGLNAEATADCTS